MTTRSYVSARAEETGTAPSFTLDDVEFVAHGSISALDMSDMAVRFRDVEVDGMGAVTAFAEFFRTALGAAEYARFLAHTRAHRTDQSVLFEVMTGLVEDFAGRPTELPTPSRRGQSSTGRSSKAGGSSRKPAKKTARRS